jgi:CO/xanthine dehydrogenase Mo-binding subunit
MTSTFPGCCTPASCAATSRTPRSAVSTPRPRGRLPPVADYTLTIYAATQAPHEVRLFCSRLLGLPEHRIRVVMRDTGGAFGQKIMVQRDEMCLMLAAPKMGLPVKWVEDRRENLLSAGQSRHEHGAVRMAFGADGTILAAAIDFSDCGAYPTPWPVGTAGVVGMLFPGPYRVPQASFTARAFYTNTVGRAAYRGPWQFETLAREVLLDIAARRIGIDPMELRRRNLLREDELPYTNPNGLPYDSIAPGGGRDRCRADRPPGHGRAGVGAGGSAGVRGLPQAGRGGDGGAGLGQRGDGGGPWLSGP